MTLADDVGDWQREWVEHHVDLIPDWLARYVIEHTYPGGWVKFLSEYGFIKGETE